MSLDPTGKGWCGGRTRGIRIGSSGPWSAASAGSSPFKAKRSARPSATPGRRPPGPAHPRPSAGGTHHARLAAGFGIGTTTAYRYVTEAIELLAALAPSPADAVRTASVKAYLILDGTHLPIDRIAADRPFYFGKHKKHGMNVQVIADPFGRLLWASPALPGASTASARPANTASSTFSPRPPSGAGRQGLPRCWRHGPHPVLETLGDPLRRPEGGEPLPRKDSGPRRAGRRHPQVLASPPQTEVLDHPDHQPRPGRPHTFT